MHKNNRGVMLLAKNTFRRRRVGHIYGFAFTWIAMALILPLQELWALITAFIASFLVALIIKRIGDKKDRAILDKEAAEEKARAEAAAKASPLKKSYGPEIDPVLEEGNKALSEMGRLYASIKDPVVRGKINEIMRITDKITQDAISDPSDIPQIKKFLNYYIPTTIKLLNAYDRMSSQGIEGENLDKSMNSINEMLDTAIEAYKKRLDSLFANQALDIETDIDVMNSMLAREGLSGGKDFDVKADSQQTAQAQ